MPRLSKSDLVTFRNLTQEFHLSQVIHHKAGTYLGPYQTSMIEFLAKYRKLLSQKRSITDICLNTSPQSIIYLKPKKQIDPKFEEASPIRDEKENHITTS